MPITFSTFASTNGTGTNASVTVAVPNLGDVVVVMGRRSAVNGKGLYVATTAMTYNHSTAATIQSGYLFPSATGTLTVKSSWSGIGEGLVMAAVYSGASAVIEAQKSSGGVSPCSVALSSALNGGLPVVLYSGAGVASAAITTGGLTSGTGTTIRNSTRSAAGTSAVTIAAADGISSVASTVVLNMSSNANWNLAGWSLFVSAGSPQIANFFS